MTVQQLNPKGFALSPEVLRNLERLSGLMCGVEAAYGHELVVTSGYRTFTEHTRIYQEINRTRAVPLAIPVRSLHLQGLAVDVADPSGELWRWCLQNLNLMERLELYLEVRQGPWVHVQCKAPRSGKRIFHP